MSHFAQLRAQLASLNTSITELERRRDTVQAELDGLAYPILTIPNEIISEIFVHCLAPPGFAKPDPGYAPLLVMRVCKKWTQIAIATPALWDNLALDTGQIPWELSHRVRIIMENFIDTWFGRAGSRALSLNLEGCIFREMDRYTRLYNMVHILHLHSPRIQSLALNIAEADFLNQMEEFPLLEKLIIGFAVHGFHVPSFRRPYTQFSIAPRLREVTFTNKAKPSMFLLPWNQLTKFTGDGLSADECLQVLRMARALVECRLSVHLAGGLISTEKVNHDQLQFLRFSSGHRVRIRDVPRSTLAHLLALLRLPSLQNLELENIIDLEHNRAEFFEFLSYASSSLHRFSCPGNKVTMLWPSCVNWFRRMPHLVHLELAIDLPVKAPEFMNDFIYELEGDTFLPLLQTLQFVDCIHPFRGDIIRVLTQRVAGEYPACAQLKSFRLIWPPGFRWWDEGVDDDIERLRLLGLDIYIGPPETSSSVAL